MVREKFLDKTEKEREFKFLKRVENRQPLKYAVIMHNDDYTTQDFVVMVLVEFFQKTRNEAQKLMLAVHIQGRAKIGIYIKDVAISKINLVISCACKNGMPLVLTAEHE